MRHTRQHPFPYKQQLLATPTWRVLPCKNKNRKVQCWPGQVVAAMACISLWHSKGFMQFFLLLLVCTWWWRWWLGLTTATTMDYTLRQKKSISYFFYLSILQGWFAVRHIIRKNIHYYYGLYTGRKRKKLTNCKIHLRSQEVAIVLLPHPFRSCQLLATNWKSGKKYGCFSGFFFAM